MPVFPRFLDQVNEENTEKPVRETMLRLELQRVVHFICAADTVLRVTPLNCGNGRSSCPVLSVAFAKLPVVIRPKNGFGFCTFRADPIEKYCGLN